MRNKDILIPEGVTVILSYMNTSNYVAKKQKPSLQSLPSSPARDCVAGVLIHTTAREWSGNSPSHRENKSLFLNLFWTQVDPEFRIWTRICLPPPRSLIPSGSKKTKDSGRPRGRWEEGSGTGLALALSSLYCQRTPVGLQEGQVCSGHTTRALPAGRTQSPRRTAATAELGGAGWSAQGSWASAQGDEAQPRGKPKCVFWSDEELLSHKCTRADLPPKMERRRHGEESGTHVTAPSPGTESLPLLGLWFAVASWGKWTTLFLREP